MKAYTLSELIARAEGDIAMARFDEAKARVDDAFDAFRRADERLRIATSALAWLKALAMQERTP
jgi:hypothetical protein